MMMIHWIGRDSRLALETKALQHIQKSWDMNGTMSKIVVG